MGVLSFCRVTLRRGRELKRSKSSRGKGVNHNHNGNKRSDVAAPGARVEPQAQEARFALEVVRCPPEATVEYVRPGCRPCLAYLKAEANRA